MVLRIDCVSVRGLALVGCWVLAGCIFGDVSLDGKQCPCASGYVCDDAINTCVRELEPRDGSVGDAGDAGSVGQLGDPCSGDSVCQSGLCVANACTTPCGRTADCPSGFSCLPTGSGYRVCVAGASYTTPSGEACTDPGNTCQSGICESGTCVERCTRDAHCSDFGNGCVLRQEATCGPALGASAIGEACSFNADCASGICDKYQNACAASCCTDGDCAQGEQCLVYDLSNDTVITICQPSSGSTEVRCCTDADCNGGSCRPMPGPLPGAVLTTCSP
jgi:hypothetical protein